jgi:hypothetical protein
MPWWGTVLSGVSLLVAMIGLIRTFFVAGQAHHEQVHHDLGQLQERCSLLEMKMGMFWRLVEEHLSGMLKRPTHHEMDALLDKLRTHTLTQEEAYLLRSWLQQVYLSNAATPNQQRLIALLVAGAVESLITEFEKGMQR